MIVKVLQEAIQETAKISFWEIFNIIFPVIAGLSGVFIGRKFVITDKKIIKNKETLEKIKEYLPLQNISQFRIMNFGGAIKRENLFFIDSFVEDNSKDPELIFLDKDLEKIKHQLIESISNFYYKYSDYAEGYSKGDIIITSIPQPPQNKNYDEQIGEINFLADEIIKYYDKLLELAKRKLI